MSLENVLEQNDDLNNFFVNFRDVINMLEDDWKLPRTALYEILWKNCLETANGNAYTHLIAVDEFDSKTMLSTEILLRKETEQLAQLSFDHQVLFNDKSLLKTIDKLSRYLFFS